jgi:hypothetical protein
MSERSGYFKDSKSETVIYQHPNLLLILFLTFSLIHLFVGGGMKEFIGMLGFGFGVAWSYNEATEGVNGFRKTLGFAVLIYLIGYAFYRSM